MKKRLKLSTTHIIIFSFLAAIACGTLLLSLPISAAKGQSVSFIDAFFTATSATCVTGLVTLPVALTWSYFGQAVILCLIQIGGLGVITVLSCIMLALRRKFGLHDRLLIQDAFNLDTLGGLGRFLKKVFLGTMLVEGAGALLYMTVFISDFGAKGIWVSVFNAVSAFCNAGMDVIGTDSLIAYATNPIVNAVTCSLIVIGGIGFLVWWDLLRVLRDVRQKGLAVFRHLTLHSKIALSSTACLIVGGALLILLFEYNNPLTLQPLSFFDKLQVSFFQSVTTRTAGFATLSQATLTEGSALTCLFLMFVGGSPVGTAGGIKTVTVTVLVASALSSIRGKDDVTLFDRTLSKVVIRRAIAVLATSFFIMFTSTLALSLVTDANMLDLIYETVSATATVGLSRDLTPLLDTAGKAIVCATMFFGRIGPISLATAFANVRKNNQNLIKCPVEDVRIG